VNTSEILVVVGGVAAVAFVLWYSFGARQTVARAVGASGAQEIKVTVRGGYSPDLIVVKQGRPVRLDFYRDETASCSDRVSFGDFGIARDFPAYNTRPTEFTSDRAGEFTFTCGMNMMRGKLVVEGERASARQRRSPPPVTRRQSRRARGRYRLGPASLLRRSSSTATTGRPCATP